MGSLLELSPLQQDSLGLLLAHLGSSWAAAASKEPPGLRGMPSRCLAWRSMHSMAQKHAAARARRCRPILKP